MNEILSHLERWQREAEEIALATVVAVRGSAPRPLGARLCMTRSGRMVGSVSGGCVENDVFERALRVLDDGRPALAHYGAADEWGFEVGLACGGSIDVLIEPFAPEAAWNAVRDALERQRPAALCVGVAPDAQLGRKLAVTHDGACAGSVDPDLDAALAAEARRRMGAEEQQRMGGEGATVLELLLRGEAARVLVEVFPRPLRLFIVGATDIAISLCRMAKELGFCVTVIDARSIFATEERFPEADELVHAWPDEAFDKLDLGAADHVVTLTHDPKFDLPALARGLRSRVGYVGALGSRVTHERRKEQLREQGFGDAELARIRTPVGLDIGSCTPEEIALSILAELVAARSGRDGRPLVERSARIHDDT
jgi:xanthine dehydrogenase accessory factor